MREQTFEEWWNSLSLTDPPPEPERKKTTMNKDELIKLCPTHCPKCGSFVERQLYADDKRLPGLYCNKEGCGWTDKLPAKLDHIRLCATFVPRSVLELLKIVPLNETGRSHLLSIMEMPVPKSCTTFEQIEEWVNTIPTPERKGLDEAPFDIQTRPNHNQQGTFSNGVVYSYTEIGRCNYRMPRSGSDTYNISAQQMRELMNECSSMDEFVRSVRRFMVDMANDDPPETDGDGDTEYYDYDSSEEDDHEYSVDGDFRANLSQWINQNVPGHQWE